MKLGNNGWGMKELIIYSCVLLSFLLFAMVMLDSFYADLEKSSGSVAGAVSDDKIDYYDYENEMKDAVIRYISDNNITVDTGDFVVDVDTLIRKDYLSQFYDVYDESKCSGYIVVKNVNGIFSVKPNLICSNYKTDNGV